MAKNLILRDKLSEILSNVRDIERLSGKIGYGNVMPKDLVALRISLEQIPLLHEALTLCKSKSLVKIRENLLDFSEITKLLKNAIKNEPPSNMREGGYIAENFNPELDELRNIKENII